MKLRSFILFVACSFILPVSVLAYDVHEITFCGEKIPVADRFVADKLMGLIKKQMNYSILSQLRQKENEYMKTIEYYLMKTGLPEDIKYVAIVESGLRNVISPVGAAGFWQIMKPTAGDLNLIVNGEIDERNDINKSTYAACKLLAQYYLKIRRDFRISSWVLTTAAYNNGIGNISNAIKRQGENYFVMNLNKETAEYVYKIIAVKELLEFPELYMQGFGYNIFTASANNDASNDIQKKDLSKLNLGGMSVKVNTAESERAKIPGEKTTAIKNTKAGKEKFIAAEISGKYKNFMDGGIVSFTLKEDLQVQNRFTSKGMVIQGRGWIIDNRVLVDLGYDHYVVLMDYQKEKGVPLSFLKSKENVLLKISK